MELFEKLWLRTIRYCRCDISRRAGAYAFGQDLVSTLAGLRPRFYVASY